MHAWDEHVPGSIPQWLNVITMGTERTSSVPNRIRLFYQIVSYVYI